MKALIYKEFVNIKIQLFIIWAIYGLLNVFFISNSYAVPLMTILMNIILLFSAFTLDEKVKFEYFILSTPVSRLHIVLSKYIFFLMITFINLAISTFFLVYFEGTHYIYIFRIQSFTLSIVLILCSLILPMLFRFGVEKGRLIFIGTYFAFMGIILYLSNNTSKSHNPFVITLHFLKSVSLLHFAIGLLVFSILFLGFSIFLSHSFYKKREF